MRISDSAKSWLRHLPPEFLESRGVIKPAKKGWICPACGNGSGRKGDGILFNPTADGTFIWHCFSCQLGGDVIALMAAVYGMDARNDFNEVCTRALDDFGANVDFKPLIRPVAALRKGNGKEVPLEQQLPLIRADIASARDNLDSIPDADRRGLSLLTLKHFHCGYLPNWVHPVNRVRGVKVPPSRRLIVPSEDGSHYLASACDRANLDKTYWKMHAGKKSPFGLSTITANTATVFVFEGEVDAMSAWQSQLTGDEERFVQRALSIFGATSAVGIKTGKIITARPYKETGAIATGGASERNFLDALDRHCKNLRVRPLFIVSFDADKTGNFNAPQIQRELSARGYLAATQTLGGTK